MNFLPIFLIRYTFALHLLLSLAATVYFGSALLCCWYSEYLPSSYLVVSTFGPSISISASFLLLCPAPRRIFLPLAPSQYYSHP